MPPSCLNKDMGMIQVSEPRTAIALAASSNRNSTELRIRLSYRKQMAGEFLIATFRDLFAHDRHA